MQEGTISGNAACESLDLSKQICLELTKKKEEEQEGDMERQRGVTVFRERWRWGHRGSVESGWTSGTGPAEKT